MDINKQICGYAAVFSDTGCIDNAVMMTEKHWFSIIFSFSFQFSFAKLKHNSKYM